MDICVYVCTHTYIHHIVVQALLPHKYTSRWRLYLCLSFPALNVIVLINWHSLCQVSACTHTHTHTLAHSAGYIYAFICARNSCENDIFKNTKGCDIMYWLTFLSECGQIILFTYKQTNNRLAHKWQHRKHWMMIFSRELKWFVTDSLYYF